ncbi:hypothetical protein MOTHE_c15620 [Moorella thermoacetica]|nr:hypothetical protein MOTHE_c15620 [Moorella thermoacetica]
MEKTLIIDSPVLKKGFTSAPNAVLYDSSLSIGARWLYIILLSFAWQENECWPGHERLAQIAGCHRNTIEKYLKELRTAGLVSWKRRGLNQTNIYYLHDPFQAWRPAPGPGDSCGNGGLRFMRALRGARIPLARVGVHQALRRPGAKDGPEGDYGGPGGSGGSVKSHLRGSRHDGG